MFALFSLSFGLVAFAAAQQIHDVTVGSANGSTAYCPESIFAQPGDQVVFHFQQKNHTVSQSSFADPCSLKPGGFDSGFMPVAANVTDNFPTYTIQVNDTQPIWVYCRQAAQTPQSHCGAGMVFAVNCGQDGSPNSFSSFKNAALAQGASLKAAATSTSSTPTLTYTAAFGGITIAPPPSVVTVTQTITVETSTWTTTYASYPNSPAPTPDSLQGNVINVVVGGPGKLMFDPPRVSAKPRDTIVFQFKQKNHTVTQSSFDDPCRPLNKDGKTGFNSGYFPVADGATIFPTYNLTINDTAPIWAFCAQANHCQSGMVFAVNSDESSGRNYTAFKDLATKFNGTSASANSATPSSSAGASSETKKAGAALSDRSMGGSAAAAALFATLLSTFF